AVPGPEGTQDQLHARLALQENKPALRLREDAEECFQHGIQHASQVAGMSQLLPDGEERAELCLGPGTGMVLTRGFGRLAHTQDRGTVFVLLADFNGGHRGWVLTSHSRTTKRTRRRSRAPGTSRRPRPAH